ncbi:Ku protein [Ramlibacter sp. XY19]|uniref:non-homologous end joining protein Ku n=1 Tax=Ramlibacter paludis TaxID=2908000 RepID=UPI0023DA8B1E|nr:Ku protein [Ramlibacter paludis]MCG2592159.1 Ku protein [Ramlibacter paludis]
MAPTSTRTLWKGAITFGLVHIPIALHSATEESDVDFDWLDRRTMDPVGYKRINKRTGREIDSKDVVKGVEHGKGNYVVLSAEEIAEAFPRTTQTIEIEAFVDLGEVPFVYLERPYYTAPINKGEKVYALLREALTDTGKAGLAKVVIHSKQHLAVLVPMGPVLVLNLLRWGGEIRSWADLDLPPQSKSALKPAELKMAKQLIDGMSGAWSAEKYRDSFHEAITKLVEAKAKAGKTETVEPLEEAPESQGAEVIDLTELLRRSLKGGGDAKAPARKAAARKAPAKKSAARKAPAAKSRARRAA